jgi:hypothetical protein
MQSQEEWSTLQKLHMGHMRYKTLWILAPLLEGMTVIWGLRDKGDLVARLVD